MERTLLMLGRYPSLSLAELVALAATPNLPWQPTNVDTAFAILPWTADDARELFWRSGGLVRLATVIAEGGRAVDPEPRIIEHLAKRRGRIVFGLSALGHAESVRHIQELGLRVKRALNDQGRSVRFVFGREAVLSSATIRKNHLLRQGEELLLARQGNAWWLASALVTQPFEEFGRRDVGRPHRDLKSGTLPPKLARLMVNLSVTPKDGVFLDPFLGSGTVLQEAMLLGLEHPFGSDVSAQAVEQARQNLTWVAESEHVRTKFRTLVSPVEQLSSKLPAGSVDGIATEPYLGPALTRDAQGKRRDKIIQELSRRYLDAFASFAKVLRPGARAVVVFPVFARTDERGFLPILDEVTKRGFRQVTPLPDDLMTRFHDDLSYRKTLLYHRPGQHVWREITIFERR